MHKLGYRFLFVIGLLACFAVGSVAAAEVISEDGDWTLEAGETIDDDLYLTGNELLIDGVVNGDVIAIGNYLRIKGEVNGDVIFIGGGLWMGGTVNGDIRAAATSIDIRGTVEESLTFISSGFIGFDGPPVQVGTNYEQRLGVHIIDGVIKKDVFSYSGLFALQDSQVMGDVLGQMSRLVMESSQIQGDVDISVIQITVDEESRVLGPDGFRYSSVAPADVSTLTEKINYETPEVEPTDWLLVLRSIVGRIAGMAILGWFLLRFRPNWLIEPVAAINTRPGAAGWLGFFISAALIFGSFMYVPLIVFFWGALAAFIFTGLIFFGLGSLWVLSPLVAGLWFGQRLSSQPFQGLLFGCSLIAVLQAVPLIGFGISVAVFTLALGGLILAPRIEQLPSQV